MSNSIYGTTEYLPNLPGYRLKNKVTAPGGAKRVKMFRIIDGLVFPKDLTLPNVGGEFNCEKSVMALGSGGTTSLTSRPQSRGLDIKNVNVVLTFVAYFYEANPMAVGDNKKTARKVNISFYTEDGTMSIVERPVLNSGVPQGTLCARAVVWKSDGNPVNEYDFTIGEELEIFGQMYCITDCDLSTRRYFQRSAGPGNNEMSEFESSFDESGIIGGQSPTRAVGDSVGFLGGPGAKPELSEKEQFSQFRSKKNSNKTFMEAQLGNTVNNSGRDGFIRYGNKTLKFRCVWDNTAILYGDMVEFSLVYFLADDTVEIFSLPSAGAKDQFSRLLQRSKLPKKFDFKSIGNHAKIKDNGHYHWSDLSIGLEMDVYARRLRILDADSMTRSFYESFNFPLQPKMDLKQPSVAYHEREIPPSTGFGSEEDSLRSCQGPLQPGPPRIKKLGENRVLTFLAALISEGPDAAFRRFVITFYVQDQTFKVEEKPIRNSGYVGGVFLSRRVITAEDGTTLTEKDLYLGAVIPVFKHEFQLLETDEVTLKWMEDKKMPNCNILLILEKLRCNDTLMRDAFEGALATAFIENGGGPDGKAPKGALVQVLGSYGFTHGTDFMTEHEVLTIVRAVGDRKNIVNYNLLIKQIISPTLEL